MKVLIHQDIIKRCYPCTIKRETNFFQPKQGYPNGCRTTLILQTEIITNILLPLSLECSHSVEHPAVVSLKHIFEVLQIKQNIDYKSTLQM